MLKSIALILAVALAALLLYAATRPDTFAVQRSALIQASPDKLFPLINDLHQFNTWNPYARKDPAMRIDYRGPASGPGAAFDFSGNKDAGKGSIEVTGGQAPTRVDMRLDMVEPFEGHNQIAFTLTPQGQATQVTWAMHGPSPYLSKVIGIFLDMDHMIGRDFEAGLARLKATAETR
ncbi:polyketide cyclase [Aquabacterium soli]|uniref:Polyketide cyclase n=1 Tax=Aquabacterium soli TaxID=2493092 RepID=A0A3R8T5W9_9BURK|nr:SRPBCC family protein [Aquabacterium soli]RRS04811.1 polyketide cyclase [Aquabacterium soli]